MIYSLYPIPWLQHLHRFAAACQLARVPAARRMAHGVGGAAVRTCATLPTCACASGCSSARTAASCMQGTRHHHNPCKPGCHVGTRGRRLQQAGVQVQALGDVRFPPLPRPSPPPLSSPLRSMHACPPHAHLVKRQLVAQVEVRDACSATHRLEHRPAGRARPGPHHQRSGMNERMHACMVSASTALGLRHVRTHARHDC